MDLELIKHFIVVARMKNITHAAETLFISQPALSRRISALENSLGVQLLIRNTHNVELTEAGVTLYEQGQELLKKAEDVRHNVLLTQSNRSGHIHVATERVLDERLVEFYQRFGKTFPEIEMKVSNLFFGPVVEALLSGSADIGIIRSYELELLGAAERFRIQPILHDRLCLFLPPNHPLSGKKTVKSSELAGMRVSVFKHLVEGNCRLIRELLESTGMTVVQPLPETHEDVYHHINVRSAIGLTERGGELALQQGLELIELSDRTFAFDFIMLWDKRNANPALPLFLDAISADLSGA